MELLQLRYFKMIAETEHITKVAEELSISQSALSKTIKILETELGVKLFDREGKYIKLNQNGKIFLKYVNKTLQSLEDAKKELLDHNHNSKNEITIYVQAAMFMLPKIISMFSEKHPHIKFHISQKQFSPGNKKYDFMIYIPSPNASHSENTITLLEEEIVLAVNKNHKLANRKSVSLCDLSTENFISLPEFTQLRISTDHYCRISGLTPNIILECYDSPTILELVKNGMGISFVPRYSWGDITDKELSLVSISSPKCTRLINLTWDDSEYLSNAAMLFKKHIIEFYANLLKK
ncbi:LysR family transcriptional regulator [Geosporobacter ferrireducens]|uniref:HTH lysR-type domain-containing protein n=1 Tax=Geosporobacter ferrireducens TaxID=1424294 RepID=A0A1D8GEZ6_9FIRM|nr:LysR family transcriptional regulator [Geosporobacter ferrireducens]AOT69470.1 hypothetical protein Gferi_07730 [Geosporobacter ferrireducens]